MAFFSKAGNILRQAVTKHVSSDIRGSNPSVFQMIRCMSSMSTAKVFVGGLSYATDDISLNETFGKYGEVIEARVIIDRETGRSRGFGFVTFTSSEAASAAIQALDGQDLQGRRVKVNYANERPPRSGGFGGGSYGSGGGYGGGGNYGGGGGYGGADNYGGGSNYGNYGSGAGGGGSYGGNYGGGGYAQGGTYGGGSVAGGNSYGSGGSVDNYGGGSYNPSGTYASGTSSAVNYGGGSGTGSAVNNGSGSQSFSAAGGAGVGSDSYVSGDGGVTNSFGTGGFDGSIGSSGNGEQLGSSESSGVAETYGGFGQDDPIGGNYKDEDGDDEPDNYANRKA